LTKIYSDDIEQKALDQFNAAMLLECNVQGALMPDAHAGYVLPIGAVIKTKGKVFPAFTGYDIGCGVLALELAIHYSKIDLTKLKEHILKEIPLGFNIHKDPQKHESLDFKGVSYKLLDLFSIKGVKAIGTLGGGKDYCFQAQR
jgi:tRNA-splicing ligase RtcB